MPDDATTPTPPPSLAWALVDPYGRLGPGPTAALGVLAVALGLAGARLGVSYAGFLDMHIVGFPIPLRDAILAQLVAVPLSALVIWAVCRALGGKPSVAAITSIVAAARVPVSVMGPISALLLPDPAALLRDPNHPDPKVIAIALALLPFVAWHITLLVFGIRSAAGLVRVRLAAAASVSIVLAEIVSVVVMMALSR